MREDVAFNANGTTLRGWFYTADAPAAPCPTMIMAHGFPALKEMGLNRYAEVFAATGFGVLAYDNRNLGSSDGEPRDEIDPVAQMRDYRHAVTYAQSRTDVDNERIGMGDELYRWPGDLRSSDRSPSEMRRLTGPGNPRGRKHPAIEYSGIDARSPAIDRRGTSVALCPAPAAHGVSM